MTCLFGLVMCYSGTGAGHICFLQNAGVCMSVFWVDPQDLTENYLMEFQGSVQVVHDSAPYIRESHGIVEENSWSPQVLVIKDSCPEDALEAFSRVCCCDVIRGNCLVFLTVRVAEPALSLLDPHCFHDLASSNHANCFPGYVEATLWFREYLFFSYL